MSRLIVLMLQLLPILWLSETYAQDLSEARLQKAAPQFEELKQHGIALFEDGRELKLRHIQLTEKELESRDTAKSLLEGAGFRNTPENLAFLEKINPQLDDIHGLQPGTAIILPSVKFPLGGDARPTRLVNIDLNRNSDSSYLESFRKLKESGAEISKDRNLEEIASAINTKTSALEPETIDYLTGHIEVGRQLANSGKMTAAVRNVLEATFAKGRSFLEDQRARQTATVKVQFQVPGKRVCYRPKLGSDDELKALGGQSNQLTPVTLYAWGEWTFWACGNSSGKPVLSQVETVKLQGSDLTITLIP